MLNKLKLRLRSQKKENNKSRKTVIIKTVFFYIFEQTILLMFKILAKINKLILPSFSKQRVDLAKAKKWQMAIISYRYYVTTRALDC